MTKEPCLTVCFSFDSEFLPLATKVEVVLALDPLLLSRSPAVGGTRDPLLDPDGFSSTSSISRELRAVAASAAR